MRNHHLRMLQKALTQWGEAGSEEDPGIGDAEKRGADAARYLLAGGNLTAEEAGDLGDWLVFVMQNIAA